MQSQLEGPIFSPKELTEPYIKEEIQEEVVEVNEPKKTPPKKDLSKETIERVESVTWTLESKLNSLSKKVQSHTLDIENITKEINYLIEVDKANQSQLMDAKEFQNSIGYLNYLSSSLKRVEDQNKSLKNSQDTLFKNLKSNQDEIRELKSENRVCYSIAGAAFVISLISLILRFFS